MKIISVALSILLSLALLSFALADGLQVDVKATANVNVRDEPNLNGSYITDLKADETRPFGGETSVDDRGVTWYLAAVTDDEWGWISSRYSMLTDGTTDGLEFDSALAGAKLELVEDATLAVSPYKGIGAIDVHAGDSVVCNGYSILADDEVWYSVSFNGEDGWIMSDCLDLSEGE